MEHFGPPKHAKRVGELEWIADKEDLNLIDEVPEELTHVNRWADAMRARPAALSGMPVRPAA